MFWTQRLTVIASAAERAAAILAHGLSTSRLSAALFLFPIPIMSNVKTTTPAKSSEPRNECAEAKTPPTARVEFCGVSAAIWPKTVSTAKGNSRETYVVTLTRSYKDGEERKRTHTLFPEQLLPASMALIKAWEMIENGIQQTEDSDA